MKNKLTLKSRIKIISIAILIIIATLYFNLFLSLNTFKEFLVNSISSQYYVSCTDLQRKIEKSIKYGKKLDNFFGIDQILEKSQKNISDNKDINISILSLSNKILHSTNKETINNIPQKIDIKNKKYIIKKNNNNYCIYIPVKKRKEISGFIVIDFSEKIIEKQINKFLTQDLEFNISIFIIAIFIILVSLNIVINMGSLIQKKAKITVVMVICVCLVQIFFSSIHLLTFKDYYLKVSHNKSQKILHLLDQEISPYLHKGLALTQLFKMENILGEIVDTNPEIKQLALLDTQQRVLYLADKLKKESFVKQDTLPSITLYKDSISIELKYKNKIFGYLQADINHKIIRNDLYKILLDSLTVLIICILFFIELLIIFIFYIEKNEDQSSENKKISYQIIRPAAFIFMFGMDICISFIPLFMEKIYTPVLNISKDMILGLPISAEMLLAGVGVLIAGFWIQRKNWYYPFFISIIAVTVGSICSWLAIDSISFIASRAIVGLGYGLFTMSCQGFIVTNIDYKQKARGMAQLFAGMIAGSICGGAAGAMLAERLGFRIVFILGGICTLLTIAYAIFFMSKPQKKNLSVQTSSSNINIKNTVLFITKPKIAKLLLMAIMPTAAATVGFLYYMIPLFMNKLGQSQSNTGRIFMIYGICVIYIGPILAKIIDRARNKLSYILLGGILGGVSFVTLYFQPNIIGILTAIIILGIADSFSPVVQIIYAIHLSDSIKLGEGKSLSIFNICKRFGQVVGPIIFASLIIYSGFKHAFLYFGVSYIIISIIMFLTSKKEA